MLFYTHNGSTKEQPDDPNYQSLYTHNGSTKGQPDDPSYQSHTDSMPLRSLIMSIVHTDDGALVWVPPVGI